MKPAYVVAQPSEEQRLSEEIKTTAKKETIDLGRRAAQEIFDDHGADGHDSFHTSLGMIDAIKLNLEEKAGDDIYNNCLTILVRRLIGNSRD